jgi:hypothetical protein
MKVKFVLFALLLTAALQCFAGAGAAVSSDPFTLWFDENLFAMISVNGGPIVFNPGHLGVDPLSGMYALYYPLPEPVVEGDVGVQEFDLLGVRSDGLRFENGLFGYPAVMFYFSGPGDNAYADTGFPAGFPCCDIQEVGNGQYNWFNWYPGGNIYHGGSDTPGADHYVPSWIRHRVDGPEASQEINAHHFGIIGAAAIVAPFLVR